MKPRTYKVTLLAGRQFLNGREVQTLIDAREKTCSITDTGDRELLAIRAFEAGSLAARNDPTLRTQSPHVIADTAGVGEQPAAGADVRRGGRAERPARE